mgnify:CR=1 FL=1
MDRLPRFLKPNRDDLMEDYSEELACVPAPVDQARFNPYCELPYGLITEHIHNSMTAFVEFLGFVNQQLHTKSIQRLESFLMPANFSSIVGEFMSMTIPRYCDSLVKNRYHNGHPDLIPSNAFPEDAVQHSTEGIEIKGSRHASGWQGHNAEAVWLMVFHFDSNTANDVRRDIGPKPFRFLGVYAAQLDLADWNFSGRSATSRRTITASVNQNGVAKMRSNWVYRASR